ncbi:MAG: Trm112 family protein [Gammaproteobacteria bacterium]|nr:Trm112 family protein [Gammaproteobacteria bacterium]
MIDPKLLDILVCPLTKKELVYNKTSNELWSSAAGLAYPVKDGIPVMVVAEARELTDAEKSSISSPTT